MLISFSTAALFPRTTLEALKLVKQSGFTEAEIMPQCRFDLTAGFAKQAGRTGIHVSSMHFPLVFFPVLYNPCKDMMKEAKKMVRDIVRTGEMLGTKIIVIHALAKLKPYQKSLFAAPVLENLQYLCDAAATAGITIALENNPKTEASDPEKQREEIKKIDRENLVPAVDTTESFEAGIDPIVFLEKAKPRHMHLSDHDGRSKHLPVGRGNNNWSGIIGTLKAQGYSGLLVMEPVYQYFVETAVEELSRSFAFLKNLL
ncbi:MAG: sugar phosphate isomerase/epimerase family protein [Spirochaetota bacterium]